MSLTDEIDRKKANLLKTRFENELIYLKNENKDDELWMNERIADLEEILKQTDKIEAKADIFTEIDKYTFRKPWNKMQPFHKIKKIKEFIENNYENESQDLKTKLLKECEKLLNNKKLGTKKSVVYDPEKEVIESIPAIKINSDKTFTISST